MFTRTTWIILTQRLLLIAVFALANQFVFADTIKINPTAQYISDEVGTPKVREQCHWDKLMIDSLVRYSRGRIEITNADLAMIPGKTLNIVITKVHTADGGGYSGPKWGYVDVTLKDNGNVIQKFEIGGRTNMGRAWTACGELDRIARVIAKRTAKRLARMKTGKHHVVEPDEKLDEDTDTEDSDKQ